ncbi:MAG: M3 family metallopeptidase [Muribaculaceae bacterium]|nr:M3 family metallopeptidase [Muribaculaceae bacterium]
MKHQLLTIAASVCTVAALNTSCSVDSKSTNPFMEEYTTPYEIPPFDKIAYEHYLPAFEEGVKQQKAEIQAIIDNPETPTFENTILAMDMSGELLEKVAMVFFALTESDSSPEMIEISEVAMPLYSQHSDEIMMNDSLFQRVKYVYDHMGENEYSTAQKRCIEDTYKAFTRNGALLDNEKKDELMKLNLALTDLYLKYNKNILAATNAFELVVEDSTLLSGLPTSNVAVAAEEAVKRGHDGKWVFTLHAPSRLPLLQFADSRDLRQQMYEGYITLASKDSTDNKPIINDIVKNRVKKAQLLGFNSYADYMTDNVMAKTVENAENLLMKIWEPAVKRVKEEVAEMQAVVDAEGGNFKIAPWDYYYYAEKVRKQKYDLDENEVRQYFACDSVLKGVFHMANRLYGITFTEMPDAPKYNPEVKVYDVKDAAGEHVAVFMTDYFPRASKRQGAWMSEFKGSYIKDDGTKVRPVIYNVGNFSKPTSDTPSLLTLDEVETMFHEFGHGLHGMLSQAKYKSQAGTNVDRDFVELPSQIHEHWAMEPELIKFYAHHYKTGEVMPDELIAKLQAASTHNQGFATTELASAALIDLQWGKINTAEDVDVEAFEKQVAEKLGLPAEVQFRYRSTYFKHIFGSDGYAAGYYTYLWAEVLDADGFELFQEKGVFDPETAKAFKENILEMGGSEDPMKLYINFRGQEPNPDALLRNRGLLK